jgi:uncharacterized protein YneF (UPF0154 family)
MNQTLITSLAISLSLTIVLEIGFFILTRKLFTNKCYKKDLLLVVLVNVLTNPVVVLLYWLAVLYTDWNTAIVIIPLELFAVLTEGFYYKKYGGSFRRPYLFSAAANIFSFGTGVSINMLI